MLKKTALSLCLFGLMSAAIASPVDGAESNNSTMDCEATYIPKEECEALVTFYNSTDGDNWYSVWQQSRWFNPK